MFQAFRFGRIILSMTVALFAGLPAVSQGARIDTPQGALMGERSPDGAIETFKGIPYAVPPVGVRRWTAAAPAPGWSGVRDATRFGPACIQGESPETISYGPGKVQSLIFAEASTVSSEDCLYLNVVAPAQSAAAPAEPLPVMVWIHGGAFVSGQGSSPAYNGEQLARKGVIVVTINYRLGVFGFFAHPELVANDPVGNTSNFAITDQIMALNWVKQNISAFGGDPGNVTIFGESAGSWAISMLLATPLSEGLFHKAIGESGAYFDAMPDLTTPSRGLPSAVSMGKTFGDMASPDGLAGLRSLTAQALQKWTAPAPGVPNFGQFAVVDGKVFREPVRETFAKGEQRAVPVIVGFNSDEGSGLSDYYVVAPAPENEAAYQAEVQARFGDLAPQYLKQYPATDLTDAVFDAYRDSEFGWRMEEWAGQMEHAGAPAWLYYFSHVPPIGEMERWVSAGQGTRKLGAFHAAEVGYVFGTTVPPSGPDRARERAMSDMISSYWARFATTGNPNGDGAPDWKRYRFEDRQYMRFNEGAIPSENLLPGSLELHRAIDKRRAERNIPGSFGQAGLFARTEP
jgi:para-nitrobenzyl esterase